MICKLQVISQIFYYIASGIGLLLAGFAGFKVLLNWASESREKNKFKKITSELKEKYPREDMGKTFELVKVNNRNPVYIIDKNTKFRIWIDSPQRLYELEYDFSLIKEITQTDLDSYKEVRMFY